MTRQRCAVDGCQMDGMNESGGRYRPCWWTPRSAPEPLGGWQPWRQQRRRRLSESGQRSKHQRWWTVLTETPWLLVERVKFNNTDLMVTPGMSKSFDSFREFQYVFILVQMWRNYSSFRFIFKEIKVIYYAKRKLIKLYGTCLLSNHIRETGHLTYMWSRGPAWCFWQQRAF